MYQIGIDVGGTFTDFVLHDDATGETAIRKLPSTPDDPSRAGVEGIRQLCEEFGFDAADLSRVLHGTTIATNIILQHKGAKIGLITTEGFRDILHIGRKKRPLNFSNYQDVPRQSSPLVPRHLRIGVPERVRAPDGIIETALDEDAASAAIRQLVDQDVEAIAICLLFAFLNPVHELRIKEIAREICPDVFITCSHEVSPLHREYERFSTTALNAYVGPETAQYIDRFSKSVLDLGTSTDLRLMTSAGGLIGSRIARDKPVSLLLSGPVGALIKGVDVGEESGFPSVITLDVGGTSADVGVAHKGVMRMRHILDTQIGDYDAMVPMVDLSTIGAGGGSIAHVDEGGMFYVGPRSAGATPGPACYMKGGTEPTVTDAMVCLGWFRSQTLTESGIAIDPALAEQAIRDKIATPLGISVEDAALGIYRIACKHMIDAIRLGSISKGFDPREFALIAFGGAGAAFTAEIARDLGIPATIVPRSPGVGAAAGLLSTDIRYEYMLSHWAELSEVDISTVAAKFDSMKKTAAAELENDGFTAAETNYQLQVDCRYKGQGYELAVDVPGDPAAPDWLNAVAEGFHTEHEREYLRSFRETEVQMINLRLVGRGDVPKISEVKSAGSANGGVEDALITTFDCVFADGASWQRVPTRVLAREKLALGTQFSGPAIVEQQDTTTIVPPGFYVKIDQTGNMILGQE